VERREIEIFLVLADELHFGRAATRLHVSTPRISQTVKKLEQRFGAALFDRTSRRVALTPLGRDLRDDLAPALARIDAAVARATAAGREAAGVVRVGFFRAAAGRFLLEVGGRFEARYPGSDVVIRENQLSDGLGLLRAGDIDVLFLMLPFDEPDLVAGPVLVREQRMLAVSSRHPFARRESVTLNDLGRDKVLRLTSALPQYLQDAVVPPCTPDGQPIRHGPTFGTVQEMLSLVGAGKGMYPAPAHMVRYYARPDVVYLPIVDGPPFEWALTWRRNAVTERIRAFNQAALDLVGGTAASSTEELFGFPD
jgi:DNA-binding transcriptional LysR family regulator